VEVRHVFPTGPGDPGREERALVDAVCSGIGVTVDVGHAAAADSGSGLRVVVGALVTRDVGDITVPLTWRVTNGVAPSVVDLVRVAPVGINRNIGVGGRHVGAAVRSCSVGSGRQSEPIDAVVKGAPGDQAEAKCKGRR
jgi:hypothetical protein